jgi:transcriptional regulator
VQAWGRPKILDDEDWLRDQLAAITTEHEKDRDPPWAVDDAPGAFIAGQIKGIVGLEIPIDRMEGKWKASQNQPTSNRTGVVRGLRELDPTSAMAALIDGLSSR